MRHALPDCVVDWHTLQIDKVLLACCASHGSQILPGKHAFIDRRLLVLDHLHHILESPAILIESPADVFLRGQQLHLLLQIKDLVIHLCLKILQL